MSDPRAFIVVITAAVLLYAAITDLQEFRTRNELILCLIMLWLVHVAADHEWTSLYRDIGFAALLFIFMLYFYARSWMGGGDVKLATVAFLWTGADRWCSRSCYSDSRLFTPQSPSLDGWRSGIRPAVRCAFPLHRQSRAGGAIVGQQRNRGLLPDRPMRAFFVNPLSFSGRLRGSRTNARRLHFFSSSR
jgi:hypothetical protein